MINTEDILGVYNTTTFSKFTVSWKMTDWCNYRCPYCITGNAGAPLIPQEVIEKRAARLNQTLCNARLTKPIQLHLVGGEVTYYDLARILDCFDKTNICTLSITTNFSRDNSYFIELDSYLKQHNISFAVLASYHLLSIDSKSFLRKMCNLRAKLPDLALSCGIVLNNENYLQQEVLIRQCVMRNIRLNLSIERTLQNKNIPVNARIRRLIDFVETAPQQRCTSIITTSDKEYKFSSTSQACGFIMDGGFKPQGYFCSGGLTSIRVLPNGDVARAGCAYLQKTHLLGNLDSEEDILMPTEPVVCQLDSDRRCQFCYKVNITKSQDCIYDRSL